MCASTKASSVSDRNRREPTQPCEDAMTRTATTTTPTTIHRVRDGRFAAAAGAVALAGVPDAAGAGGVDPRALEDVGVCRKADSGGEILMDLTSLIVSLCWSALGARRC